MKLRDWSLRRWVLVIALIILLPLIGLRLHLKWRVHRAVAELREAGHPTTFGELNQRQTLLGNEPNLVAALTNAVQRLQDFSTLDEAWRDALPVIGGATMPPAGTTWDEKQVVATRRYLTNNHDAFVAIHEALALTNAGWQCEYSPEGLMFRGIVEAKNAASHLSLEAAYQAQTGDVDAALRSVIPIFKLAERMHAEPTLIAHLVRVAIQAIGLQRLEYVLGTDTPAAPSLADLRDTLRRLLTHESLAHMYRGELVFLLEPSFHRSQRAYLTVEWLPPDPGTYEDYREQFLVFAYRLSGLADQDLLYAIKANTEIATRAASIAGQAALASHGSDYLPSMRGLRFHYWSEQHVAALVGKGAAGGLVGNYGTRFVEAYGKLAAADAALAVTQYRLQKDGKLPAMLADMVPEFLSSVPVEPMSGKPFDLITTADGFGIGRGTSVFSVKRDGARRVLRPGE